MSDLFRIKGGIPLKGTISVSGAKNVALKVLTASLLFEGEVILKNIPQIGDVYGVMGLIQDLGGEVEFVEKSTVRVNSSGINANKLDLLVASKIRASFMFFAPLLHRFNEAHIPNPGGCRLGARPIDRVVSGMEALGVTVNYDSDTGFFHANMNKKPQGRYRFSKVSHTGTELLIMLGAISDGETIIENAALEPEVDDLIMLLNDGGASIRRYNDDIIITGAEKLVQKNPFTIRADRNEAATHAVLAITTEGDITLTNLATNDLDAFNKQILRAGGGIEALSESEIRYFYQGPLKGIDITTEPHPGFMTDWQPPMAIMLTQAEGESLIHEKMFENRFSYVEELQKVGADIQYVTLPVDNPDTFYEFNYEPGKEYKQAIRITGKTPLHNAVLQISDLRAGATLAIAALIAPGESIVHGAQHLERGYEDFVEKVRSVGGTIDKA